MHRMQAIFTNASAVEGNDLVVLGEPARLTQPGRGSLHNPALGQRLKNMPLAALDHLHVPTKHAQRPIDQTAHVAAIGKDGFEAIKAQEQPHQQSPGSPPILNACRMHHHDQQQPHRVYGYVALAPFDSFACVISALPLLGRS